jgi:hypothetical protein
MEFIIVLAGPGPDVKMQTNLEILLVKNIKTRTSCGERPSEGVYSRREHVFILDISSASHKSQVGKEVGFQVPVSMRRVWTRSLKRATLRTIS